MCRVPGRHQPTAPGHPQPGQHREAVDRWRPSAARRFLQDQAWPPRLHVSLLNSPHAFLAWPWQWSTSRCCVWSLVLLFPLFCGGAGVRWMVRKCGLPTGHPVPPLASPWLFWCTPPDVNGVSLSLQTCCPCSHDRGLPVPWRWFCSKGPVLWLESKSEGALAMGGPSLLQSPGREGGRSVFSG